MIEGRAGRNRWLLSDFYRRSIKCGLYPGILKVVILKGRLEGYVIIPSRIVLVSDALAELNIFQMYGEHIAGWQPGSQFFGLRVGQLRQLNVFYTLMIIWLYFYHSRSSARIVNLSY